MSLSEWVDLLSFLFYRAKDMTVGYGPGYELPNDVKEALILLAASEPQAVSREYYVSKLHEVFDGSNAKK